MRLIAAVSIVVLSVSALTQAQRGQRIRIGTIVPQGSLWDESLRYMAQDWSKISDGAIRVQVFSGGTLGDEVEMIRKVRQGQLQGVAVSSIGLSRIDDSVSCLQVPMMLDSYAELDYVRNQLEARLEKRIEAKGFKVLNWTDGGWVRLFSKEEANTPNDLRRMKLFTSAGDPETESLYKQFGFQVVPLSLVDLVTSLQTGMIEAVPNVPLFAQLQELHKLAPHMLDVKWTPIIGGTLISARVWSKLPPEHQDAMLRSAREAGLRLRGEIRQMGDDAIAEMSKRGLRVTEPTPAALRSWHTAVEDAYPSLRGNYCPAELFDDVLRLRDEYRASR